MNGEVQRLLRARDTAFRFGDALRAARRDLQAGVTWAKRAHADKIQSHFASNDPRSMWQGIKAIIGYNRKNTVSPWDPSLPDSLNAFYARFEPADPPRTRLTNPEGELPSFSVSADDVRKTLQRINPHKAAEPDNIPGRVLKACAHELTEVWTDIFNTSLPQAVVPVCLKTSSIVPVPKCAAVRSMNDYRPVALTLIVMKCFERLVMDHIKEKVDINVDPDQYVYRRNRSVEDAISPVIHSALTHLESRDTYVRLLFLDFSSAFNTIDLQILVNKLLPLGLPPSLCNWVLDFLTHRPQTVRIHGVSSSTIINTGSPQGCVLSPLFYTLLTYDCSAKHPGSRIVKFADDTVVVGQISHGDESAYRQEVEDLVDWCRDNNLCINVGKTKEMVWTSGEVTTPPPTSTSEEKL
ncbi:RNA-binding protein 14a isoform X2 [Neoarius graeffei]|uniref:RNA-binding protein 14a isoform X2 n=1 Tax=Neoarius graeffei TaxID=443677 RepID=UPI00298CDFCA|nr:RNA-binding protein 14a isoform X2 [Neoarius graeffei]XP_060792293.1 RNA-binding protein 14a isoform X2 [Neoarius graeffei]